MIVTFQALQKQDIDYIIYDGQNIYISLIYR